MSTRRSCLIAHVAIGSAITAARAIRLDVVPYSRRLTAIEEWLEELPADVDMEYGNLAETHPTKRGAPEAACLYFIESVSGPTTIPILEYVGQTYDQPASRRLARHSKMNEVLADLVGYPGANVFVRFGFIATDYWSNDDRSPVPAPDHEGFEFFPEEEQRRILSDVEAALIFHLQPRRNERLRRAYRRYPIRLRLDANPWGSDKEFVLGG
jgi:hypothetical protein